MHQSMCERLILDYQPQWAPLVSLPPMDRVPNNVYIVFDLFEDSNEITSELVCVVWNHQNIHISTSYQITFNFPACELWIYIIEFSHWTVRSEITLRKLTSLEWDGRENAGKICGDKNRRAQVKWTTTMYQGYITIKDEKQRGSERIVCV